VVVLVEPCQQSKSWVHVQELCEIMRLICSWTIPQGQTGANEVRCACAGGGAGES